MDKIKFRGLSLDGWIYSESIWFNEFPTFNDRQIYMYNPYNKDSDELNIETWDMVCDVSQWIGLTTIIDNKEIYVGDYLKDEEGFIWEVLPLGDGMFKIACDDLMGVESAYPRAVCCEVVGNKFEHKIINGNEIVKL